MSPKEFAEWMALETIDPSEPHRGDAQTALICFTIVQTLRGLSGAKGKGPEFKDFLLKFELDTLTRIPYEELKDKFKGWKSAILAGQEKKKADRSKRKAQKRGKHRKHSSDPKPQ